MASVCSFLISSSRSTSDSAKEAGFEAYFMRISWFRESFFSSPSTIRFAAVASSASTSSVSSSILSISSAVGSRRAPPPPPPPSSAAAPASGASSSRLRLRSALTSPHCAMTTLPRGSPPFEPSPSMRLTTSS